MLTKTKKSYKKILNIYGDKKDFFLKKFNMVLWYNSRRFIRYHLANIRPKMK